MQTKNQKSSTRESSGVFTVGKILKITLETFLGNLKFPWKLFKFLFFFFWEIFEFP